MLGREWYLKFNNHSILTVQMIYILGYSLMQIIIDQTKSTHKIQILKNHHFECNVNIHIEPLTFKKFSYKEKSAKNAKLTYEKETENS